MPRAYQFDVDRVVEHLDRILQMELSGVIYYTHYSFMVYGHARIPITAWLRENTFRPITLHTIYKLRALRAEILKVRRQGYALVSQELELGLCSIAVPIRSATGGAVCGLNVSMRYSNDVRSVALKKMLPALQEARHAIERAVGRNGWQPLAISRSAYG